MKNSFSLIETLIATLLLSITITTLLKMKDNNLFLLSSTYDRDKINGYISIHNVSNNKEDETINIKDYISLNDDQLREELKDIKVTYKKELIDKMEFKLSEFDFKFDIAQENYQSKEFGNKTFYRVKLNE